MVVAVTTLSGAHSKKLVIWALVINQITFKPKLLSILLKVKMLIIKDVLKPNVIKKSSMKKMANIVVKSVKLYFPISNTNFCLK